MPYTTNEGIQIHYQTEGTGPPLVLQHWSFATHHDWYDYGYVSALKQDYTLILPDARGHGASDKPHDPEAYTLEKRVGDITAILDDLNVERAHFYGYSMGGWIGFGAGRYAPDRFCSLVIGGQHPYAQNLGELREMLQYGIRGGAEAFIEMWERDIGPLTSTQKRRMKEYDFKALLSVAQDRESVESSLHLMNLPCLLIAGEKDEVCPAVHRCTPLMPNVKTVIVPGIDHFGGFMRSEVMIPLIKRFLESVESAPSSEGQAGSIR